MTAWRGWVLVAVAAGCHHTAQPQAALRQPMPTTTASLPELPLTKPVVPDLEAKELPASLLRTSQQIEAYRRLTEHDCLLLSAAHASTANLLDEENQVPPASDCNAARDQLKRSLRYFAALELRNHAAAEGLECYFQLSDVEARTALLREGFPVVDALVDRAQKAKAAGVKFPLDLGDLTRRRSQLVTDLEQAKHGSRLLNLDLKRRLGLPSQPETECLWPEGDFAIDPVTPDAEQAVNVALADRPELRGLRALYHGLTPDTLPDSQDYLRALSPLLGERALRAVAKKSTGPSAGSLAELEVRRKQILDLIATRERGVADETRAALLGMNTQVGRVSQAKERLRGWEEKLVDAVKKREANQPGAELLESQGRTDVLKAKAEVVTEVAGWHQARIRLKAAQGRLAWEAAPAERPQ